MANFQCFAVLLDGNPLHHPSSSSSSSPVNAYQGEPLSGIVEHRAKGPAGAHAFGV
jgi:hypothetical protein